MPQQYPQYPPQYFQQYPPPYAPQYPQPYPPQYPPQYPQYPPSSEFNGGSNGNNNEIKFKIINKN